jgi:hypothetical protein
MSLGGNISSGYTRQLTDNTIYSGITKSVSIAYSNPCCNNPGNDISGNRTSVASQPSMVILGNPCALPTPAEFALFPKVAIPCSVRLQQLTSSCVPSTEPTKRFAKYQRYQVPVPCPPLQPSANMAGKSLPSSLQCNIYPNT